jgi:small conductance mechanosensitive channel
MMDQILEQATQFYQQNIVPYAWNIVIAVVIFLVGKWVVARLTNFMRTAMEKKLDPTIARFLARISYGILLAFVAIAALDQVGIQTTSLVAILGAAGLAIGLALKDSLGNFASGVMLIMFRPFKVGDYVEAGGTGGTVTEVRIFATILTTPDNKVITVPNGSIMSDNITNYSAMPTRRVDMVIGVSYDADLKKVRAVIKEMLEKDERVLPDPAPTIVVGELADSSVNFLVRPWVNAGDYWPLKWDFTEAVKIRFDEEGIGIPFPQMDVHLDKVEG